MATRNTIDDLFLSFDKSFPEPGERNNNSLLKNSFNFSKSDSFEGKDNKDNQEVSPAGIKEAIEGVQRMMSQILGVSRSSISSSSIVKIAANITIFHMASNAMAQVQSILSNVVLKQIPSLFSEANFILAAINTVVGLAKGAIEEGKNALVAFMAFLKEIQKLSTKD